MHSYGKISNYQPPEVWVNVVFRMLMEISNYQPPKFGSPVFQVLMETE